MKKPKLKFVKLTITSIYYGVGKDLEEAKDFAFNEFLEHQSQVSYAYDVDQEYAQVKEEDVSLDKVFIETYEE